VLKIKIAKAKGKLLTVKKNLLTSKNTTEAFFLLAETFNKDDDGNSSQ